MNMYWVNFFLIIVIIYSLTSIVSVILRRVLGVVKVKTKFGETHYINDKHEKIDRWMRAISSLLPLILLFFFLLDDEYNQILYFIFIITFSLDYCIKILFEWKHSDQPKQAIVTVSELLILITAFTTVFYGYLV